MAGGGTVKVVVFAIAGNTLITIGKFFGWVLCGSPSLLAEGIHSFADSANQLLLYVGIKQSTKDADDEFQFGYGSTRYIWNLISAMGIFFIGFGVTTYHGVHSLLHPAEYTGDNLGIPIAVLLFALCVDGYVLLIAAKETWRLKGKQSLLTYIKNADDPTTVAVLLEDGIATLGVLLALGGLGLSHIYQSTIPDAIMAILIGVLLGLMAIVLAWTNSRLLIGRSVTQPREEEIKKFLKTFDFIETIESFKSRIIGPGQVRVAIEIELNGEMLIDRKLIGETAQKIRDGKQDPTPALVDTADRMIRRVGSRINQIEVALQEKFPEIHIIDLIVN